MAMPAVNQSSPAVRARTGRSGLADIFRPPAAHDDTFRRASAWRREGCSATWASVRHSLRCRLKALLLDSISPPSHEIWCCPLNSLRLNACLIIDAVRFRLYCVWHRLNSVLRIYSVGVLCRGSNISSRSVPRCNLCLRKPRRLHLPGKSSCFRPHQNFVSGHLQLCAQLLPSACSFLLPMQTDTFQP